MNQYSGTKTSPEGTQIVSARQEHETIFALFANGFESRLHIPTFSEVAMQIQPDKPPNLLFHHQRDWVSSLPMDVPGVDGILLHIRQLPGFDEIAFQDALRRKAPARIPLLRRAPAVNARLDPASAHPEDRRTFDLDFENGFQLASSGEHIPWKMTMDAALAHFGIDRSERKDSRLRLGPVQMGALWISEITASSGIYRSDIPITSWSAKIVLLQDGWAENERLLIAYFRRMLGDPANVQSIPSSGETTTSWKRGGISVTMTYRQSTVRQPNPSAEPRRSARSGSNSSDRRIATTRPNGAGAPARVISAHSMQSLTRSPN